MSLDHTLTALSIFWTTFWVTKRATFSQQSVCSFMLDQKKYMRRIGEFWHYYRRVPKHVSHLDKRRYVKRSTKTKSFSAAVEIVRKINEETEALWQDLELGNKASAPMKYDHAVKRARVLGLPYKALDEIASGPLNDILHRLEVLEARNFVETEPAVNAVMGSVEQPTFDLETVLEHFFELNADVLSKKAPDQIRKWKNPKVKAFRNLISVIGNKPIHQLTRNDALSFRSWWSDRIQNENMDVGTANKDIGTINNVLNEVSDKYQLGLPRPFAQMRLKGETHNPRPPFTSDFVQNKLLAKDALKGLNPTAQAVVYVMAFTGMRPSEIVNLDKTHILLDHDFPHVKICAGIRSLKTRYSERHIPLVGMALEAVKRLPDGFSKYHNKADAVSALINKFLKRADLLPTPEHTLYSLRHTFQDRLIDVECPDRIQAELMGHKFIRPKYGKGPSLEQKTFWMKKVAYEGG